MIIPELPAYLREMGGEQYIGLIIGLFTVTAGGARPFSGKWSDHIGRVPVMVIGALVSCICGAMYAFVPGVFAFLALRLIHGFSTGFTPTGSTAYVADITEPHRRGEAMGLVGLSGSLGMAAGPALGSILAKEYGYDMMFYASSFTGFIAFLLIANMRETLPVKEKFTWAMWKVKRSEVYESRVLAPAFVLLMSVLSFGTMITLVPDLSEHLQLENKGTFFSVFTISSVFVRFSAGKISDRIGREKVLVISTALLTLAMITMGLASEVWILIVSAVLFGLAQGINSPTVMAWTIDKSDPQHVGRAMSTVYIAMEIGIGLGAFLSGSAYGGHAENFIWIFFGSASFSAIACVYLLVRLARRT